MVLGGGGSRGPRGGLGRVHTGGCTGGNAELQEATEQLQRHMEVW